jgi:hypothetical protein
MRSPHAKLIAVSGAVVTALGISAAFVGPSVFASDHSAASHVRAEAFVATPLFSGVGAIGATLDVRPAPVHLSVAPRKKVVLTAVSTKPTGTTETITGTVQSIHGNVIVVEVMCRSQVDDVVVGSGTLLKDGSTAESLSKVTAGEKITAVGIKVSAAEIDATSVQVGVMCDPGSPQGSNPGGYGPGDPKGPHHS